MIRSEWIQLAGAAYADVEECMPEDMNAEEIAEEVERYMIRTHGECPCDVKPGTGGR